MGFTSTRCPRSSRVCTSTTWSSARRRSCAGSTTFAVHSRYTEVRASDVEACGELEVVAASEVAGLYIVKSVDSRQFFVFGHPEYDTDTLRLEYERDMKRGIDPQVPANYFPGDDPRASRSTPGAVRRSCSTPTGSTITCTRPRRTTFAWPAASLAPRQGWCKGGGALLHFKRGEKRIKRGGIKSPFLPFPAHVPQQDRGRAVREGAPHLVDAKASHNSTVKLEFALHLRVTRRFSEADGQFLCLGAGETERPSPASVTRAGPPRSTQRCSPR